MAPIPIPPCKPFWTSCSRISKNASYRRGCKIDVQSQTEAARVASNGRHAPVGDAFGLRTAAKSFTPADRKRTARCLRIL